MPLGLPSQFRRLRVLVVVAALVGVAGAESALWAQSERTGQDSRESNESRSGPSKKPTRAKAAKQSKAERARRKRIRRQRARRRARRKEAARKRAERNEAEPNEAEPNEAEPNTDRSERDEGSEEAEGSDDASPESTDSESPPGEGELADEELGALDELSALDEDLAALDQDLAALDGLSELVATRSSGPLLRISRGFLATEGRYYPYDQQAPGATEQALVEAQLELDLNLASHLRGYVRPWFLIDGMDTELIRYEPLDGYLQYSREHWDIKVGQFVENWAMTDAGNPIDVLNRPDQATDFFDPQRRGELGGKLRIIVSPGDVIEELSLSVYAMPVWRATPLPTDSNRFTLSPEIATIRDDLTVRPTYAEQFFGAARIEHTLSTGLLNADVQYVATRGPHRQPLFVFSPNADGTVDIIPQYFGSTMFGMGISAVPNSELWSQWAIKGEVAHHRTYALPSTGVPAAQPYTQFAVGFEHTVNQAFSPKATLLVIGEYLGETGADDQTSELRPLDSDIAVATRWSRNDAAQTRIELRTIMDVKSGELIAEAIVGRALRFIHRDLRLDISGRRILTGLINPSVFALLPDNSSVSARMQFAF